MFYFYRLTSENFNEVKKPNYCRSAYALVNDELHQMADYKLKREGAGHFLPQKCRSLQMRPIPGIMILSKEIRNIQE